MIDLTRRISREELRRRDGPAFSGLCQFARFLSLAPRLFNFPAAACCDDGGDAAAIWPIPPAFSSFSSTGFVRCVDRRRSVFRRLTESGASLGIGGQLCARDRPVPSEEPLELPYSELPLQITASPRWCAN